MRSRSRSRTPPCRTWHTRRSAVLDRPPTPDMRPVGSSGRRAIETIGPNGVRDPIHPSTAAAPGDRRRHRLLGRPGPAWRRASRPAARLTPSTATRQRPVTTTRPGLTSCLRTPRDDLQGLYAQALASFYANTDEAPGLLALGRRGVGRRRAVAISSRGLWSCSGSGSSSAATTTTLRHAWDVPNTLRKVWSRVLARLGRIAECRATRMMTDDAPAEAVALAERGKERAQRANEPEAYALLLRQAEQRASDRGDDRGIGEAAEAANLPGEMASSTRPHGPTSIYVSRWR